MKIALSLLISSLLTAQTIPITAQTIPITAQTIPITLEHATTPNELAFGLMNRKSLKENHGMSFNYKEKQIISCWMFNCFIDLSLAFLDENHTIVEIHTLKAYPEMMDSNRPVTHIQDLARYPNNDPITSFFESKKITSQTPVKYAVEMEAGWFEKNNVSVGDQIFWDVTKPNGTVIISLHKNQKFSVMKPTNRGAL